MLRLLIGIVTGVVAGGIAGTFFNSIGYAIYPRPANFDLADIRVAMDYFEKMPNSVRFLNLAGTAFGAFVAGLVACKIASSEDAKTGPRAARIAGFGMLVFQAMFMAFQASQPWWFHLTAFVVVIPMALLGGKLIKN